MLFKLLFNLCQPLSMDEDRRRSYTGGIVSKAAHRRSISDALSLRVANETIDNTLEPQRLIVYQPVNSAFRPFKSFADAIVDPTPSHW